MFLLAHKFVRRMVLGLMFFLAGTACCWCDSYDPDPYDDIPPVVTVEFNYVVPKRVSIRRPAVQTRKIPTSRSTANGGQRSAVIPQLNDSHVKLACLQSPCHMVIPLRR
jgi:hypothetical protein